MTDSPPKPALTAEEWTAGEYRSGELTIASYASHTSLGRLEIVQSAHPLGGFMGDPQDFVALIAFANAALPDDSPYKITREMVEIIRQAGLRIGREGNPYLGFAGNLSRYADKLSALLPPNTSRCRKIVVAG